MSAHKVYTYAVVTGNGSGVHSTHWFLSRAVDAAELLAAESFPWGDIEIERIEHVSGIRGEWPRRYQMRQRKRWVEWQHDRDASDREPDMYWPRFERETLGDAALPPALSLSPAPEQEKPQ